MNSRKIFSRGFTLIELVIVIVILGILAASAAPKFINLQSDAKKSVVMGLKAALNSAYSMVHAKAIIQGKDKIYGKICLDGSPVDSCSTEKLISISAGYPSVCCGSYSDLGKLVDGFDDTFTAGSIGPGEVTYVRFKDGPALVYGDFSYNSSPGVKKRYTSSKACGLIIYVAFNPPLIYELVDGC